MYTIIQYEHCSSDKKTVVSKILVINITSLMAVLPYCLHMEVIHSSLCTSDPFSSVLFKEIYSVFLQRTLQITRDLLIWQKWEFLYCHKNLGFNDQDRKIYGIICYCCHIGNYPPWQLLRVKQLIIYLYLNSNCATFPT